MRNFALKRLGQLEEPGAARYKLATFLRASIAFPLEKHMAKKTAKKTAAPKPPKISAASKPRTKGEIYTTIAEHVGLSRKQVALMFDAMGRIMAADLGKGTDFNVPGLMRVRVIKKPATKGGMRPNPFKPGEMMEVKPRPARNVIKVRPLKGLKSMV